jgi:hypothetical protein
MNINRISVDVDTRPVITTATAKRIGRIERPQRGQHAIGRQQQHRPPPPQAINRLVRIADDQQRPTPHEGQCRQRSQHGIEHQRRKGAERKKGSHVDGHAPGHLH